MVLEKDTPSFDPQRLAGQIASYVGKTLHSPINLEACEVPAHLPVFVGRTYDFFEARIAERECLLMLAKNETDTPGDVAKQVHMVEGETGKTVIVGFSALSARDRARLIGQGVSFIVPGNQFYVPTLGMDLREYFRAQKSHPSEGFSPVAQAVFFHHMLRRDESATTASEIAKDLRYSPMSVGRAFDELAAFGLAETEKLGRERHLRFRGTRREMMEGVRTLLRSPVKSRKLVWGSHIRPQIIMGGESALAALSDLSPPRLEVFAMAATAWKGFAASHDYRDVDFDEADFAVETWTYDPAGLSGDGRLADPLSLYAQFWDHDDERIAMAADQLLERVPW
jgi:hypothetical protein